MAIDEYIEINTDDLYVPQVSNSLYISRENAAGSYTSVIENELSIAVISHNRLDKTKVCVENLIKNTHIPFNLILIDSGSEANMMEYYKGVEYKNKTILRITKNINANYSFLVAMNHLKSKYCAIVSNDVVVPPNAIKNLLTCLKSSNKIGWVSPVASNISNLQQVTLNFNSLDEMNEIAEKYNVSNPLKWCERLSLNPAIFFYRKECIDVVGGFDYGFFHDYADDEMARRINRAGYKTILCRDAWVHHDHIYINTPEQNIKRTLSLNNGRKNFRDKYYDLDAIDDIRNYELQLVSFIEEPAKKNYTFDILGVDTRCGTPIVEIRNKLKEYGMLNTTSQAFTTKAKYYHDLQTVCEKVECDRIDFLTDYYEPNSFDYILLGEPINSYNKPFLVLNKLYNALKLGGTLLFKQSNTSDYKNLLYSLGIDNHLNPNESYVSLAAEDIQQSLAKLGATIKKFGLAKSLPSNQMIDLVLETVNKNAIPTDIKIAKEKLMAKEYVFCIKKPL